MAEVDWTGLSYGLGMGAQAFCAVVALSISCYAMRNRKLSTEEYLTARGTVSCYRIAWSMFAAGVGAWVVSTVPSYGAYAGIIGVVFYAISAGVPLVVLALMGPRISQAVPHVHSVADFAKWRYGPTAKLLVCLIVIFNLSIALTAEYTTIGSIFQGYVDGQFYPIILSCAAFTTAYTAYGGLGVAIITDQIQGIATVILVTVLCIYLAVNFREPLPPPLPDSLGSTAPGWSAVFVMPCSLICATVFSEAMWQRCWAAADDRTLLVGSILGCAITTAVVFVFGIAGLIGAWSGVITEDTSVNLYIFTVLRKEDSVVSSGIAVAVIVLACFMNTGAVDSLQTGITASLTSHFFKGRSLLIPRALTLLVQIPIVYVASQNYNVLQLFVTTNMLTVTTTIPLVIGLHPRSKDYVTENCLIFSVLMGILTITAYGIAQNWNPDDVPSSFSYGSWVAWVGNNYMWDYFLVSLLSSSIAAVIWVLLAKGLGRCGIQGVGVSEVLSRVPGWQYLNGEVSDDWYSKQIDTAKNSPNSTGPPGSATPTVSDSGTHAL